MYWTNDSKDRIFKAHMDGSNVEDVVTGLSIPAGIAIDPVASRLFWVDYDMNKVQSSRLDGHDVHLVTQLSSRPWGIAVDSSGRLFWGTYDSKLLQTSETTGINMRTLHTATHSIQHLTMAGPGPVQTRQNHCEGQNCSGICVLTATSFRCLP